MISMGLIAHNCYPPISCLSDDSMIASAGLDHWSHYKSVLTSDVR